MKSKGMLTIALGCLGATVVLGAMVVSGQGQAPPATTPAAPAPLRQGPGVQATADARYETLIAACKTPPPARGGGGGQARGAGAPPAPAAGAQARGAAAPAGPVEYTVAEIPGVIAAGQKWKLVWESTGNNADGIVGTDDGGLLVAQNDNSTVLKLDKDGKGSVAYRDTNTGGALSMNSKGALFVNQRALNQAVMQLAPQRKVLASRYQDEPLDCITRGVLNDLTADSKGGVYFTMGGVFYASPAGVVTRYGENLTTNGIILSSDEKTLYVTNGPALAAFDVQADGSLKNQREFSTWQGRGGDGATVDSTGRLYVTGGPGIQVISTDGKLVGSIPQPRANFISTAFSGPDKKTLYAVVSYRDAENRQNAQIYSIPMIAQGFKGRAK
jgi:gluconolactonase